MKKFSGYVLSLMLFVGFTVSSLVAWGVYQYEDSTIQLKFKNDVDEKIASIERELIVNLEVLYALKGLWDNSKAVSLSEFTGYSQAFLSRHKSIQALEWVPKVIHNQREKFSLARPLNKGVFDITERHEQGNMVSAAIRDEYFPVYYVEPLIGNELALGFDLASNAARKKTLMRALASGKPLATSSITLVQEPNNEKGFLILIPIYNGLPTTVINRQKEIKGFIVGVFRIGDIFRAAFNWSPTIGINAKIVDVTNDNNELLHESREYAEVAQSAVNKFSYAKKLKLFNGRNWQVVAVPTREYIENRHSYLPYILGFSSMIFVLVFVFYTNLIIIRNKELSEAKKSLEKLTETDALTTISNRRCFDKYIKIEWNRAIREKSTLSLLMIDVDDFKAFNDIYGHVRGDACLQEVAIIMQRVICRTTDLIARYGGEEFVIVLPNTTHAFIIGEYCRRAVQALQIPHQESSTSEYITISVGVTSVQPDQNMDLTDLIATADKALYQAKEKGRNNVVEI